jgi:hypothetical protein
VGTLVLVVGSAAVAATGALVASCLRLRSAVGFVLAAYVVASAEIVAVCLVLSIGRWLTRGGLLAVVVGVLGLGGVVWVRLGRPRPPVSRATAHAVREALRDPVVATLAALAVAVHLYLLAVALTLPQSLPDTMLYHLPRAALWKQQHAVAYVSDSPDERVNAFPPNAEIETMASMILSRGDRYVALPQLAALLAVCASIVGIARRIGLSRSAAAFGALAFSTFTVVVLQTPTALNDLVVAAALSASAYFAMARSRTELVLAALALSLAIGSKTTAVFALPALILLVFASQPRARWLRVGISLAAGFAVGSYWYAVNLANAGSILGGLAAAFPQTPNHGFAATADRSRLFVADLFEMSDIDGKRLLASPVGGLVLLALALVVAAVLGARRRWREAIAVGLAGVFATLAFPMLTIWGRVVDHGFAHARAALRVSSAPTGPRLPDGFYETAMHSSYGLAFVFLFIGAGALVVAGFVRRTLPVSALVALAAVPLTLLVVALAVTYDPQRMRFLAFPVALASAVFGVALRLRALAWGGVVLTPPTIAVSVGYFIPRPAGLALLPGHGGRMATARWFVQGGGGGGGRAAFRFLERSVPSTATLALAVERNTYLYPAWDAGLRRRVLFVTADGRIPRSAAWLVIGPRKQLTTLTSSGSDWTLVFGTAPGWRVFERSPTR